jgi:hypothetical protein
MRGDGLFQVIKRLSSSKHAHRAGDGDGKLTWRSSDVKEIDMEGDVDEAFCHRRLMRLMVTWKKNPG